MSETQESQRSRQIQILKGQLAGINLQISTLEVQAGRQIEEAAHLMEADGGASVEQGVSNISTSLGNLEKEKTDLLEKLRRLVE